MFDNNEIHLSYTGEQLQRGGRARTDANGHDDTPLIIDHETP